MADRNDQTGPKSGLELPRAEKPVPYMGVGLFVDPRALESRRRVMRAAHDMIRKSKTSRAVGKILSAELLMICRTYWAQRDYDKQPTFGEINAELRGFQKNLSKMLESIDKLLPVTKREINIDLMFFDGNNIYVDRVADARAVIEKMHVASGRVRKPHQIKQAANAVPNCCATLQTLWEKYTGRKFTRTKTKGKGSSGAEFTAEGPWAIQVAMKAVDGDVDIGQLTSWLAKGTRSKSRKKSTPL